MRSEPRAPLMVPYLAYLLILAFQEFIPPNLLPLFIAAHTAASIWICWLFRHHFPPLGAPFLAIALVAGLFAAWMWVAGQHVLDNISVAGHSLGERMTGYSGPAKIYNPHEDFGDGRFFWLYVVLKIARAVSAVPLIEELFWRGFLLRAFVSWDGYDRVPWGRFSWRALIGTALLSTVQHPNNWGVSIACWLLYNLIFYWKKSLLCLMLTHAVTNLALYCYVVRAGDWRFW